MHEKFESEKNEGIKLMGRSIYATMQKIEEVLGDGDTKFPPLLMFKTTPSLRVYSCRPR